MLCPVAKFREVSWRTPFIILLDLICEAGTDFQQIYNDYFPTVNPRQFTSRGRRYGAIELAVGGIAYELSVHLDLDINEARTNSPSNRFLVNCRKNFERRYLESLVLLKNVRRRIGSTPSIFWYYPADTIFTIMAQYSAGPGTEEANNLVDRMLGSFINRAHKSSGPVVERFINSDPTFTTAQVQRHIHEHACRIFQTDEEEYTPGIKPIQGNGYEINPGENDINYFCRISARCNAATYRNNMTNITGYRIRYGDGEEGIVGHPLSDLYSFSLGAYGIFIEDFYVDAPLQVMTALTVELETAMHIAHYTETPSTEEEISGDIYGHHTDEQEYHVKPWTVIQDHATFLTQNYNVKQNISGGPIREAGADDYMEFFNCFKFQATVQDFRELNKGDQPLARSILKDRLLVALTEPEPEENP